MTQNVVQKTCLKCKRLGSNAKTNGIAGDTCVALGATIAPNNYSVVFTTCCHRMKNKSFFVTQ